MPFVIFEPLRMSIVGFETLSMLPVSFKAMRIPPVRSELLRTSLISCAPRPAPPHGAYHRLALALLRMSFVSFGPSACHL